MKYRVHRFDIKMTSDHSKLEQFLNNLEGEIVAIIPNGTDIRYGRAHARGSFPWIGIAKIGYFYFRRGVGFNT